MKILDILHQGKLHRWLLNVCAIMGLWGMQKGGLQHIQCMGQHERGVPKILSMLLYCVCGFSGAKVCVTKPQTIG